MTQLFSAGAVTFLLLAFLAERIDAAFSGPRAMEIGVAISVIAASWWAAGQLLSHQGDLRALLLLQALPLLLVPSGAVNLAGRFTSSADWLWMLCLYGLAATLIGYLVSAVASSQPAAFAISVGTMGVMFGLSLMTFVVRMPLRPPPTFRIWP